MSSRPISIVAGVLLSILVLALHPCIAAAPALPISESIQISGLTVSTNKLPDGLALHDDLGLVTIKTLDGQVVHRTSTRILETRATITPRGDYLLMFPEGDHYAKSK